LLQPVIDFLAGKVADNPPPPPPDELNERLGRIHNPYPALALAILAPLLDAIARGWEEPQKVVTDRADNWRMLLAKQMGEILRDWLVSKDMEAIAGYEAEIKKAKQKGDVPSMPPPWAWLKLKQIEIPDAAGNTPLIPRRRRGRKSTYKFLHDDWTSSECVVAGDWMLRVAEGLPCFGTDDSGRICIAPEWQDRIDKICEELLWRHPVMLPHRSLPKEWTGWWANYGDRLRAAFVRDWRLETRAAIEATFAAGKPPAEPSGPFAQLADLRYSLPFAHADGVNALKRVPLRINQSLLPLVDKFALELMGHDGKKLKADRRTVKTDLRHARWCGNRSVYLDYNCDKRGRIFATQQLNYACEDHVRALFEFERGEPLVADGMGGVEALQWFEIHAANCFGEVGKKPWADRLRWAKQHTDLIERVAADPQGSFDHWRNADKKFAFVAACIELSRARKDPAGFTAHLPIGFDGTCNGIQHLALLSRDEEAGRLVNLIASDVPQDVYLVVTAYVMNLLDNHDGRLRAKDKGCRSDWCFDWWRERLGSLTDGDRRKLFKNPTMTFPYSATVDGMRDAIVEVYGDLFEKNEPKDAAAIFLARAVRLACEDKLPGPVRIMKYIRKLALYRFKQGKFLEWRNPTGFPFVNMYQEPKTVNLDLGYGGVRSRYTVADGALPEMRKGKILNAASPNFVHSLDAAHLIRTALAANGEGIRDILAVHDSMACLAPHARRFGQLIRREMAMLYVVGDPLAGLRNANVDDPNILPLPPRGNLDALGVQVSEYPFM
jgi:DNA-directed RNA polymerase